MLHVNCIVVISGLNVWYYSYCTCNRLISVETLETRVLVILRAIECNISLSSNKL